MPVAENQVTSPALTRNSRPLIEGPAVWTGAKMGEREAECTYRLSPVEVAEIEAAVRAVQSRGLDIVEVRRADFPLPTLGPMLEIGRRQDAAAGANAGVTSRHRNRC